MDETGPGRDPGRSPLTPKGQATRDRIVDAASDLMFERGVAGTSLDDVRQATGTSKSQLYHYFRDKSELIRAVIVRTTARVIDAQRPVVVALDSWEALDRWRELIVELQRQRGCRGGCPLGSLASELAEEDEPARVELVKSFELWESYLMAGLAAMKDRGELRAEADPATLALAAMASLQGGLLLAQTTRTTRPLEVALDAALAHLRIYAQNPDLIESLAPGGIGAERRL
jgi:TetR/AcrR family transcriptional regulator, transcriptional repressor for nem operon